MVKECLWDFSCVFFPEDKTLRLNILFSLSFGELLNWFSRLKKWSLSSYVSLLHFLTGLLVKMTFPFSLHSFLFTMDLGHFKIQCVNSPIFFFCHYLPSYCSKCGQQELSNVSPLVSKHSLTFLWKKVPGSPCNFLAMILKSAFLPRVLASLSGEWEIVFWNQDLGAEHADCYWDSHQLLLLLGPFWQELVNYVIKKKVHTDTCFHFHRILPLPVP